MLIERLRLKNILSFRDTTIELGPLQAAPSDLDWAISLAGVARQWLWPGDDLPVTAAIECVRPLHVYRGFTTGVPKKKLELWKARHKLGELWRKGEICGSRW
jgi:hypothetical protein